MCKLFISSHGIPADMQTRLKGIVSVMGRADSDGLGFAYHDGKKLFTRRWTKPSAFESVTSSRATAPWIEPDSTEAFPSEDLSKGPLMIHTRTATSAKGLRNAHPIITDIPQKGGRLAMIHNGVVEPKDEETRKTYRRKTGNDSEWLAQAFAIGGMDKVTSDIVGYYAFGAIAEKTGRVHVARDAMADLYCAPAPWGGWVWATTREILTVLSLADSAAPMMDETIVSFTPTPGGVLGALKVSQFEPMARWQLSASSAASVVKSLGKPAPFVPLPPKQSVFPTDEDETGVDDDALAERMAEAADEDARRKSIADMTDEEYAQFEKAYGRDF